MGDNSISKAISRDNSLNLIRLLCCLQIFAGHMMYHLEVQFPFVIDRFLHFFSGLPIFFMLSGFLIYKSIERTPDTKTFFLKRVLRLFPELWVCVLVELICILIFNHDPINMKDFVLFGVGQSTFFQFWTPESLRGYGVGCPNGSLWTIPPIIEFYIVIWFSFKWLDRQKIQTWILLFLLMAGFSHFFYLYQSRIPVIIFKLADVTVLPQLWVFFLGTFVSKFSDRILPFLKKYWWTFFAMSFFFFWSDIDMKIGYFGSLQILTLCLFALGFAFRFPKLDIKMDISYAIYVYHMVVVNVFVEMGLIKSWPIFFTVVVITLSISWLSTKYVGGFSQRMKTKM